jgi:lipoprotein
MKKFIFVMAAMAAMVLSSCGKDGEGGTAGSNKPSGLSGKVYS